MAPLSSGTSRVETLQLKITFFRTCALICTSKYKTTRFFLHSSIYYKMTLNLALGCPFPAHILKTASQGQRAGCLFLRGGVPSRETRVWLKVKTQHLMSQMCLPKCPHGRTSVSFSLSYQVPLAHAFLVLSYFDESPGYRLIYRFMLLQNFLVCRVLLQWEKCME